MVSVATRAGRDVLTFAERSEAARRGALTLTAAQRSARTKKGWLKRKRAVAVAPTPQWKHPPQPQPWIQRGQPYAPSAAVSSALPKTALYLSQGGSMGHAVNVKARDEVIEELKAALAQDPNGDLIADTAALISGSPTDATLGAAADGLISSANGDDADTIRQMMFMGAHNAVATQNMHVSMGVQAGTIPPLLSQYDDMQLYANLTNLPGGAVLASQLTAAIRAPRKRPAKAESQELAEQLWTSVEFMARHGYLTTAERMNIKRDLEVYARNGGNTGFTLADVELEGPAVNLSLPSGSLTGLGGVNVPPLAGNNAAIPGASGTVTLTTSEVKTRENYLQALRHDPTWQGGGPNDTLVSYANLRPAQKLKRDQQRQDILDTIFAEADARGVQRRPKGQRRYIVTAGPVASGKSTVLRDHEAELGGPFLVVNVDDVTDRLIAMDMVPVMPGLTPAESVHLVRDEATALREELTTQAINRGYDIAFDSVVVHSGLVSRVLPQFHQGGYTDPIGVFTNIETDKSIASAEARWVRGTEEYLSGTANHEGGLFVSPNVLGRNRPKQNRNLPSGSAESFLQLAKQGTFQNVLMIDNQGDGTVTDYPEDVNVSLDVVGNSDPVLKQVVSTADATLKARPDDWNANALKAAAEGELARRADGRSTLGQPQQATPAPPPVSTPPTPAPQPTPVTPSPTAPGAKQAAPPGIATNWTNDSRYTQFTAGALFAGAGGNQSRGQATAKRINTTIAKLGANPTDNEVDAILTEFDRAAKVKPIATQTKGQFNHWLYNTSLAARNVATGQHLITHSGTSAAPSKTKVRTGTPATAVPKTPPAPTGAPGTQAAKSPYAIGNQVGQLQTTWTSSDIIGDWRTRNGHLGFAQRQRIVNDLTDPLWIMKPNGAEVDEYLNVWEAAANAYPVVAGTLTVQQWEDAVSDAALNSISAWRGSPSSPNAKGTLRAKGAPPLPPTITPPLTAAQGTAIAAAASSSTITPGSSAPGPSMSFVQQLGGPNMIVGYQQNIMVDPRYLALTATERNAVGADHGGARLSGPAGSAIPGPWTAAEADAYLDTFTSTHSRFAAFNAILAMRNPPTAGVNAPKPTLSLIKSDPRYRVLSLVDQQATDIEYRSGNIRGPWTQPETDAWLNILAYTNAHPAISYAASNVAAVALGNVAASVGQPFSGRFMRTMPNVNYVSWPTDIVPDPRFSLLSDNDRTAIDAAYTSPVGGGGGQWTPAEADAFLDTYVNTRDPNAALAAVAQLRGKRFPSTSAPGAVPNAFVASMGKGALVSLMNVQADYRYQAMTYADQLTTDADHIAAGGWTAEEADAYLSSMYTNPGSPTLARAAAKAVKPMTGGTVNQATQQALTKLHGAATWMLWGDITNDARYAAMTQANKNFISTTWNGAAADAGPWTAGEADALLDFFYAAPNSPGGALSALRAVRALGQQPGTYAPPGPPPALGPFSKAFGPSSVVSSAALHADPRFAQVASVWQATVTKDLSGVSALGADAYLDAYLAPVNAQAAQRIGAARVALAAAWQNAPPGFATPGYVPIGQLAQSYGPSTLLSVNQIQHDPRFAKIGTASDQTTALADLNLATAAQADAYLDAWLQVAPTGYPTGAQYNQGNNPFVAARAAMSLASSAGGIAGVVPPTPPPSTRGINTPPWTKTPTGVGMLEWKLGAPNAIVPHLADIQSDPRYLALSAGSQAQQPLVTQIQNEITTMLSSPITSGRLTASVADDYLNEWVAQLGMSSSKRFLPGGTTSTGVTTAGTQAKAVANASYAAQISAGLQPVPSSGTPGVPYVPPVTPASAGPFTQQFPPGQIISEAQLHADHRYRALSSDQQDIVNEQLAGVTILAGHPGSTTAPLQAGPWTATEADAFLDALTSSGGSRAFAIAAVSKVRFPGGTPPGELAKAASHVPVTSAMLATDGRVLGLPQGKRKVVVADILSGWTDALDTEEADLYLDAALFSHKRKAKGSAYRDDGRDAVAVSRGATTLSTTPKTTPKPPYPVAPTPAAPAAPPAAPASAAIPGAGLFKTNAPGAPVYLTDVQLDARYQIMPSAVQNIIDNLWPSFFTPEEADFVIDSWTNAIAANPTSSPASAWYTNVSNAIANDLRTISAAQLQPFSFDQQGFPNGYAPSVIPPTPAPAAPAAPIVLPPTTTGLRNQWSSDPRISFLWQGTQPSTPGNVAPAPTPAPNNAPKRAIAGIDRLPAQMGLTQLSDIDEALDITISRYAKEWNDSVAAGADPSAMNGKQIGHWLYVARAMAIADVYEQMDLANRSDVTIPAAIMTAHASQYGQTAAKRVAAQNALAPLMRIGVPAGGSPLSTIQGPPAPTPPPVPTAIPAPRQSGHVTITGPLNYPPPSKRTNYGNSSGGNTALEAAAEMDVPTVASGTHVNTTAQRARRDAWINEPGLNATQIRTRKKLADSVDRYQNHAFHSAIKAGATGGFEGIRHAAYNIAGERYQGLVSATYSGAPSTLDEQDAQALMRAAAEAPLVPDRNGDGEHKMWRGVRVTPTMLTRYKVGGSLIEPLGQYTLNEDFAHAYLELRDPTQAMGVAGRDQRVIFEVEDAYGVVATGLSYTVPTNNHVLQDEVIASGEYVIEEITNEQVPSIAFDRGGDGLQRPGRLVPVTRIKLRQLAHGYDLDTPGRATLLEDKNATGAHPAAGTTGTTAGTGQVAPGGSLSTPGAGALIPAVGRARRTITPPSQLKAPTPHQKRGLIPTSTATARKVTLTDPTGNTFGTKHPRASQSPGLTGAPNVAAMASRTMPTRGMAPMTSAFPITNEYFTRAGRLKPGTAESQEVLLELSLMASAIPDADLTRIDNAMADFGLDWGGNNGNPTDTKLAMRAQFYESYLENGHSWDAALALAVDQAEAMAKYQNADLMNPGYGSSPITDPTTHQYLTQLMALDPLVGQVYTQAHLENLGAAVTPKVTTRTVDGLELLGQITPAKAKQIRQKLAAGVPKTPHTQSGFHAPSAIRLGVPGQTPLALPDYSNLPVPPHVKVASPKTVSVRTRGSYYGRQSPQAPMDPDFQTPAGIAAGIPQDATNASFLYNQLGYAEQRSVARVFGQFNWWNVSGSTDPVEIAQMEAIAQAYIDARAQFGGRKLSGPSLSKGRAPAKKAQALALMRMTAITNSVKAAALTARGVTPAVVQKATSARPARARYDALDDVEAPRPDPDPNVMRGSRYSFGDFLGFVRDPAVQAQIATGGWGDGNAPVDFFGMGDYLAHTTYGDYVLQVLATVQGYTDQPDLVTEDEMDEYIAAGELPIYRGVGSDAAFNAVATGTVTYSSQSAPGGGGTAYGRGLYFAAPKPQVSNAASAHQDAYNHVRGSYSSGGNVLRASVRPDAHIARQSDYVNMVNAVIASNDLTAKEKDFLVGYNYATRKTPITARDLSSSGLQDFAVLAIAFGFDAYLSSEDSSRKGSGQDYYYLTLLNRTALRVQATKATRA